MDNEYLRWVQKVGERINVMIFNIHNGNDIYGEDRKVLESLFPLWYDEELTFPEMIPEANRQSVIQTVFFYDNLREKNDGINIEDVEAKP